MDDQGELFPPDADEAPPSPADELSPRLRPLAERMRPHSLDELLGQEELLGPGRLLRELIERDRLPSLVLWGPPGCGKTSLARLVAEHTKNRFVKFSAVLSGVKEVRRIVEEAGYERRLHGVGTILFVDEIHRFNKAQQDAFLPHVEDGTITLIGATTENPSFEINRALLSRCRVLVLKPHDGAALRGLARRALDQRDRSYLPAGVDLDDAALDALVAASSGDARTLFNLLEAVVEHAAPRGGEDVVLDDGDLAALLDMPRIRHDRGDARFDLLSALHKSLRGSDPDAAVYWLARLLEAGEDPMQAARRIVAAASEDVGMADPRAILVATAAVDALRFLGLPEGRLPLTQAAIYVATAPKSNAVHQAIDAAAAQVREHGELPVPDHLRNAPTALAKEMGHGRDYRFPHDHPDGFVDQAYRPPEVSDARLYRPTDNGYEEHVGKRLDFWWRRGNR